MGATLLARFGLGGARARPARQPLRRPAAAGGDRPRLLRAAARAAARRGDQRPRPGAGRRGPGGGARPQGGGDDDGHRHPRDELRPRGRRRGRLPPRRPHRRAGPARAGPRLDPSGRRPSASSAACSRPAASEAAASRYLRARGREAQRRNPSLPPRRRSAGGSPRPPGRSLLGEARPRCLDDPQGRTGGGGGGARTAPCASSARSSAPRRRSPATDLVELGSVRQKSGKVVEAWAAEASSTRPS